MKRDRNNQFIKRIATGVLLFAISLSVMSVFNQKGNTALASEATEVERTIKVDEKKAYISVEYRGADANIYIEEGGVAAVPDTPENYSTWIFAGWYEEDTCDTPIKKSVGILAKCYAKFVPEKVLSVKCQTQEVEEGKSNLRFVTSIDTTNYYRAGFEVSREYSVTKEEGTTIEVKTYKKETNNSFKRIVASLESKVKFEYSPKVFDTKSESFVTYTIKNIPSSNYGTEFLVKPYWITLDGAKVYGVSRYVAVNDNENTVVNIPVKVEAKADGTYSSANFTVQRASKENGTESFTDVTGATVRYRANEGYASIILSNEQGLKSATKYQVSGSGTTTYVHRNLETVYAGADTEDTSWYTVYDEETTKEYVIATAADLYGLAKLSTNTTGNKKSFAGKTIYVVSDIEANKGTASETSWSGDTSHEWTPIGNNNVKFSGVFDGQMHTISAICDQTVSASYSGLFGYTADESLVSKFRLTNSYFYHGTTTDWLGYGSIVGCCEGDIDTVYSNANLNYAGDIRQIAGIAGRVSGNGTTTGDVEITNCWFDGTIACGDATRQLGVGGVVGASNQATTLDITNCLNTGSITQTGETTSDISFCIGGILGTDWGANCIITINNCLNAGSIATESTTAVGTIIGKITQKTATYSIDKTYCISEKTISNTIGAKNNAATITKNNITPKDADDVNGCVSYLNVSDLGFYGNSKTTEENEDKYWVAREEATNIKDGVPALKSFAEYIDVAWYYNTKNHDAGNNTYTIYTEEELFGFSEISQKYDFQNDTIQLGDDIEVNMGGDAKKWAAGTETPERQWRPIGKDTPFAGTFDGKEKTISGIYVNETTQNAGLFAATEYNVSTIKNIRLENSYIYSSVNGNANVGSIVGYSNRTKLTNIYSNAYVTSTTGNRVGGIVGELFNTHTSKDVSKCWFDGYVQGSTLCGGIVGRYNTGTSIISNVLVTGAVKSTKEITSGDSNVQTGGIVGGTADSAGANLTIKTAVHAGTVEDSYTGTQDHKIGGVVGFKRGAATVSLDSVYTTFVASIGTSSGTAATVIDVRAGLTSNHVASDNVYGKDDFTRLNLEYYLYDSIWVARKNDTTVPRCFVGTVVDENDIVEDTSAHTAWYDSNPDATEFEIKTENDFLGIAVKVDEGVTFKNKTIKLAKDMDLNRGWIAPETATDEVVEPAITWTPIGNNTYKFEGTFEGNGHEIRGIYASGTQYIGLFGYGNNATLKNFELKNSYVYGSSNRVGSVIGCNSGNMTEVYSDALVVSASNECGGLIGLLTGTGTNTISKCWFDGSVQGLKQTGGIIGNVAMGTKTIQHCLVTGCVKTTENSRSDKNGQTGGMIGSVPNNTNQALTVTIESCLTAGDVADGYSNATCGGIIGYRGATNTVNITDVYTTYAKEENWGIGTQSNTNLVDNSKIIQIKDIDNIKSDIVYDEEKGIDLNYSAWIARKNNIPVPRCFVGSIVPETDTVEYTGRRVYVDTDWYTFNKNPYSIETVHELVGLAQLVNEGVTTFDNKTINLVKDIDFNKGWTAPATTADEAVDPANIWMPIGNSSSVSFQGTFNGNGNTIRGIYVDENVETTYTGLFGYTKTCAITNLSLENSYFSTTNPYMGSIIGYGNGTLTNVYSDAIMHSTKIEVGGLVGRAVQENSTNRTLRMTGCWFNGDIRVVPSAASAYVGGLVGLANNCDAIIDTCLYTGDITLDYTSTTITAPNTRSGGLFGSDNYSSSSKKTLAYASISNTISAGTITGIIEDTAEKINNLCTTIGQVRTSDTQCTNVYDMSVVTKVIGGNSENSAPRYGKVENITDESKLIINQTYEKEDIFGLGAQLLTNLDFVQDAEEAIWAARRGQIPAPAGLVDNSDKLNIQFGKADTDIADGATGDTAEDPYIIENVEELYGFAVLSRTNNFAGKFIKLNDDIEDGVLNLNPGESAEDWAEGTVASLPWYSIGVAADNKRFAGHFDGNGKTISGIYMNSDNNYLGLFAAAETGSTISNLRLTNSYINYTGNGTANTGSVVGDLRGDMANVYSDAIVHSNGENTGGLIALVNETSTEEADKVNITNCWYAGQLTSSKTYVGGVAAKVEQGAVDIENSLNTGKIINTYSAGHAFVGGFCGRVCGQSVVDITDCIAAGEITDSCGGRSVRSVVGDVRGSIVNFENMFATKRAFGRALPNTNKQTVNVTTGEPGEEVTESVTYSGVYNGTIIRTHEADRLIGYCTEEVVDGAISPSLDFAEDWTIRTSDVPVPTCFADLVSSVTFAEGSTLDATLSAQIGCDTLGLSVAKAVNMGEGNYVLKTSVDDTTYDSYLTNLEASLGFGEPFVDNSNGAGADGVHSISYKKQNPDWVLTLTYVETTDVLTISINTDTNSLSDNLVYTEGVEDENYQATGDITLNMLQLDAAVEDEYADLTEYNILLKEYNSYWYGNSFVFRLPNGHFIINDGGAKEEFAELVTYLKQIVGMTPDGEQNPVYIDAWTVSHQHGDHFDIVKAVVDDPTLAEGIYVDAFYISEPNAKTLALGSLDGDVDKQYYGMTLFTKDEKGEQTDIYRMQTGQRYYFNGIIMDVIQAQEQIPYSEYAKVSATKDDLDFNTASAVLLFTTSNNQKVLIGGDANYVNMQYIMDAYDADTTENDMPTDLLKNINVLVAFHHGKNMSMNIGTAWSAAVSDEDTSFIDYLTYGDHTFDYVLYPCSLVYDDDSDPVIAFPNAEEANAYLNSKANVFEHFGNGNVEITLKGATTE